MSLPPTTYQDFLTTFEEVDKTIEAIRQEIDILKESGIRIIQEYHEAIEPHEEATLERINNLMMILNYSETGEEEKIVVPVIHELKWLFKIIDGNTPCDVCGQTYAPAKYYLQFYCKKCGYRYPKEPLVFSTLKEAKAYISKLVQQERERGRYTLYCPYCKVKEIKRGRYTYIVPQPLKPKITVLINQYMAYPEGYILVRTKCMKCGYVNYIGIPASTVKSGGETHVYPSGENARIDYENATSMCLRCGNADEDTLEVSKTYKSIENITEEDRFRYHIPFIYKGIEVPPPPPEISGVTQRIGIKIYRLLEPHIVGRLDIEYTLRKTLRTLLNTLEIYVHDKDVRARILQKLYEIVQTLKRNIIQDRIYFNKEPTQAEVDANRLKKIIELSMKLIGMLDIVLNAYLVDFIHEHGHRVLRSYREFKQAVDYLKPLVAQATPHEEGLAPIIVSIHEFNYYLSLMEVNLPNLQGLSLAKKGYILDKELITQREFELAKARERVLKEVQLAQLKSEPMSIQDKIIATLLIEGKPLSISEIAERLGVEGGKDKVRLTSYLAKLVKEGKIKRYGEGLYGVE